MMKIGIMSMQRVCNNGSFLQAYGLKKLLESLGHEVVFVDYHVGKPLIHSTKEDIKYKLIVLRNRFISLFTNFSCIRFLLPESMRNVAQKRAEYKQQLLLHLGVSNNRNYNTLVDALVIGSDEVFNCTQINPEVGYSPELFGANANAKTILSYAASFGNTTFEKLQHFGKIEELSSYFNKFSAISVRDKNSYNIIERLTGSVPIINLDPVLMYDFMPIIPDKEKRRDYIVVYAYRSRITKNEANVIKTFAQSKHKRLISVSGEMDWCDEHFKGNAFEVLDLFRHADYAITDTFHGTIFSIINRLRFVTLIRNSMGGVYGNQEKLQDLLDRLYLSERSYSNVEDVFEEKLCASIDYEKTYEVINRERIRTINYLKNQLS